MFPKVSSRVRRYFCGIDGVAAVVAETIGDIGFGVGPIFCYLLQQQSSAVIF
jgi:hypothetical protein